MSLQPKGKIKLSFDDIELIKDSLTHTISERIACPVCVVTKLNSELEHWREIATTSTAEREHNANAAAEITVHRDQLRAEIGAPLEGAHPDEAKPRAETWHKERANWREEVGQLKFEIFNLSLELQQWKSTVRQIEECCDKPSNVWDIANTALSSPNVEISHDRERKI